MIGNLFTIKQLEALIWVADLGSFRRAAEHLNTTQPNISARIAGMERVLGLQLMHRDAGSVRLTEPGARIVAAARLVLRAAEGLVEVAGRADLVQDRLRLGVTELVAATWLSRYLRRLKEVWPALVVELTVDLSRNLEAGLAERALDLVVQNLPFATVARGEVALGQHGYVWVAAPTVAHSLPQAATLADLIAAPVLTHARHTQAFGELCLYAESQGLPVTRFASSSSLTSCAQMAVDGLGVALLPQALVARDLSEGRLLRVALDWLPSPLRFAARYHSDEAALYVGQAAAMAAQAAKDHES